MKFPILLLLATSFSFAQWGGGGGGKSLNDYKKMSVSGREIHVYAPSNLKEKSPLLISCHGMDQDPNYQQSNTHWEAVADTAGFVVVYPRGGTGMSTWDISGDKDTKWMTEIIAQMEKDYKIDTKRVYLSGFSMGVMFTYNSMSKIADKIAAFAPTSGTNVMGASKAQRPVPIIHPHGTNDDVLQYNQVEGFLKNYRDQFHCPSQAEEQKNYPNAENSGATMYTWGPCDEGVYIKHLKLPGRGHSPSKADVSDIWNFVKEWTVDGKIGAAPKIEVPTDRDSVFNGSFSDSLELAGWTFNKNSGEGSLKLTDGEAEIDVTKKGSKASDIQVVQNGFHFEKGQGYKLTFDAWAGTDKSLEVDIGKNSSSKSYLDSAVTFNLGSEKKNYEIKFVMNESTDKNGRLAFNAGASTGSLFIDNVVLTKIDSSEVGGKTRIASGRVLLSSERTFSVYDTKGAFVCKLTSRVNDIQKTLNSMRLEKGLYVVKDGGFNRVFSVK